MRPKAAWLAVLAALAANVIVAGPAAAHTSLVSSDPEDGAVLAEAPGEVVLEFDETVQPDFSQVAVLDAEENHYEDGDPESDGPTVTQPVTELPAGEYRISFRVGSADGHPVTGVIAFSVEHADDDAAADEDVVDEPSGATTEPTTADSGAAAAEATQDDDGTPVATVVATMAAVAVVGIAGVLVMRRRPGSAGDDDVPPAAP